MYQASSNENEVYRDLKSDFNKKTHQQAKTVNIVLISSIVIAF